MPKTLISSYIPILLLLILPCLTQICQYCQNALQLQCKHCTSSCPLQKITIFNKCTSVNCTQNRQQLCRQYEQTQQSSLTYDYCMDNCCSDRIPLSSVIAKRCLGKDENGVYGIIIGLSVFAGASVLVVVGVCVFVRYKKKLPCMNNEENFRESNNENIQNENKQQSINQFKISAIQNEKIKQQVCSICLDGKPDTMTSCGHCFHGVCLSNWFKRNEKCPICKNKNINPVTLHCGKCSKQCKKLTILQMMREWEFLGQNVGLLCHQCSAT